MRSVLQFVGFASSAVWATLMVGTILAASAHADAGPSPNGIGPSCLNCYSCNITFTACNYSGTGGGCKNTLRCTCLINNGNPICSP